jgi:membrane protein DedA with SNARE-associated domain
VESPPSTAATAASPSLARPLTGAEQQRVRLCLGALALLGSGSLIGVASFAFLVVDYPLLLIALSPLGRHLILVAPVVDPTSFVAVGVGRRTLFYLPCFLLGRTLGPATIAWIEARAARFARFVRWLERLFVRAPRLVVAALPGPSVSALAGISGMRLGVFLGLAAAGTLVRMLLYLYFGDWLSAPLSALRSWVFEQRVPITAVIVAGLALQRWRRRRVRPGA